MVHLLSRQFVKPWNCEGTIVRYEEMSMRYEEMSAYVMLRHRSFVTGIQDSVAASHI